MPWCICLFLFTPEFLTLKSVTLLLCSHTYVFIYNMLIIDVTSRLVISVKSGQFLLTPLWSVGLPQSSASNLCSCCLDLTPSLSYLSSFTLLSFSTTFPFYIVEGSNSKLVCLWQKNISSVYVFSTSVSKVCFTPTNFSCACLWSSSLEILQVVSCVLAYSVHVCAGNP